MRDVGASSLWDGERDLKCAGLAGYVVEKAGAEGLLSGGDWDGEGELKRLAHEVVVARGVDVQGNGLAADGTKLGEAVEYPEVEFELGGALAVAGASLKAIWVGSKVKTAL